MLGFSILIKTLKHEKATNDIPPEFDEESVLSKNSSFFDIKNDINVELTTAEIMGVIAEPPNDGDQKLIQDDWFFIFFDPD